MTETAARQPARSGRRAPYANGERKRAELVDAAFAVFAEKGFQRLSIRQIAEEIGTSHTALLHHFGSKDALLEAVLVRREEQEGPVAAHTAGGARACSKRCRRSCAATPASAA